jgi:O-antigen ligase
VPRWYRLLLVSLVAWGALAFGGVYPWAYWPLIVGSAALGIWAIPATAAWRDPRAVTLATALFAVGLAMGIQLIPLPWELVSAISPDANRWLRNARFGVQPEAGWRPLSLAPGATLIVLVKFCALALLFVGLVRAIRHVGIPWFVTQVIGLGVGLAVFGVVQRALIDQDHPLVYGFWQPQYGGSPFGPFVNRNHFAGWMVMALPLAFGYSLGLLREARGGPRAGWRNWLHWSWTVDAHRVLVVGVAAVVMGLALVITGSRSGLISLAVGLAAVAALMWRRLPPGGARLAAATYVIVVVCGAVGWAGLNQTIDRFTPASRDFASRMAAWRDTVRMIEGFPWAGVGMGAYGDAMLVYQTGSRDVQYLQAHNDYLQLAAEGGLLVGLPSLILLGVMLRQIRRRLTSGHDGTVTEWVRVGAIGGLVAIGAQSLVEFSLHMPGNNVMFVILMALAVHRPARPPAHAHRV